MKSIKKVTILLLIVMGILLVSMPSIEAADILKRNEAGNKALTGHSQLVLGNTYKIRKAQDYDVLNNLFCSEKGQRLWSVGRNYKVIAHVRIENSIAWFMTKDGKKMKSSKYSTENDKVSKDYNRKLATGIATLRPTKLKSFVWGYFNTWVTKVGSKMSYKNSNGNTVKPIPLNFATYFKDSGYTDLVQDVEDDMEEMEASSEDFENNTGSISFTTKKFDYIPNEEYWRVGPFNLAGIPSDGLSSFIIKKQDGEDITESAKVLKYKADNSEIIIKASDTEGLTAAIKNNKNFYVCIPKSSNVTKFEIEIKAKKAKDNEVQADIYLLQCSDKAWQNLIVTDGKTKTGLKEVPIKLTVEMPGGVTLYKYDSVKNNIPLPNAKFVLFRYVEDSKGTWKADNSNGRGYEKIADGENIATKYRREYVRKTDLTYHKTTMEAVTKDATYHFVTDSNGRIEVSNLQPDTYYTKEIQAPEGYEIYKWKGQYEWFPIGEVKSGMTVESQIPNTPTTTNLQLEKVNEDDERVKIENVAFKFYHSKYGWLKEISKNQYQYVNENEATWFKTDSNGIIYLEGLPTGDWTYVEDPDSLPYGYDIAGKEKGTFKLVKKDGDNVNHVLVKNKQRWVRLSGYVWVDKSNSKELNGDDRNDVFDKDSRDRLLDGITVKLINSETNEVRTATTAYHGWYSDAGNNGHGEYMFEDVEIKDLSFLYIEFEYDGLTYTNVATKPDDNYQNGSKAAEGEKRRNSYNEAFRVIEGSEERDKGLAKNPKTGETKNLTYDTKDYEAILNNDGVYTAKKDDHGDYIQQEKLGDFPIQANTDQATDQEGKDITPYGRSDIGMGKHIVWGQTDIRYINLGLKDRYQPDIGLTKDMHNAKVSVNGYSHTYLYNKKNKEPDLYSQEETFNVGVKFQEKSDGNYRRAIYTADYEYNPNEADKELQVYVTYELKMIQSNKNLKAKINSIAEYFDENYTIEKIGTEADDKGNIGGTIIAKDTISEVDSGNAKYKKVIIPCNIDLNPQEPKSMFVQFKLDKSQVQRILSDKNSENQANHLLNNTAEINSYSIFDKNDKIYAGIDKNSNPGNSKIEDFKTYENDTSAAPGLQLELVDAREMTGKVFEDEVIPEKGQKADEVMTGKVRVGSGSYEEGEKGIGGVDITLKEKEGTGSGMTYKTVTVEEDGYYQIKKDDSKTVKTEDGKEREYTFTATKIEQDDKGINTHYLTKGDFYIIGYVPGKYTLTYTWGDQTYKVQDYKGTIYQEKQRQESPRWWYVDTKYSKDGEQPENGNNVNRYSDAMDNYQTRKKIDNEIKKVNKDTNATVDKAYTENVESITTKMDSSTPIMEIDVEYRDAYTDSMGRKYSYCIDKLDFGIIERAKQDLLLTKRISSLKATLANGQVIVDIEIDKDGTITGDRSGLTYMRPSPTIEPSNGFIRLELDNELIQGTKLEVGYKITATNNSELDYIPESDTADATFYLYGEVGSNQPITMTPTGIIDYLDRNWSFDSKAYENTWKVMSANGENNDISQWVVEEVIKGEGSTIGEKMILYTDTLKQNNLIPKNAQNGGNLIAESTVDINVSKVLTTTDEISLDNEAEEVEITRTGGATLETTLGNYVPGSGAKESDDSMAETTIVTPATGENLNYIIPIVVGTTAFIILGAGIILIKKKILK